MTTVRTHDLKDMLSEYIANVRQLGIDTDSSIRAVPGTEKKSYTLRGELWDILTAVSCQEKQWEPVVIGGGRSEGTFTPHNFFIKPTVEE